MAPDTNVLVRLLVQDDVRQTDAAVEALEQADQIYVSVPVLCEVAWVLARRYRKSRTEVATALRELVARLGAEVDFAALQAGLSMLEKGGDFADGINAHQASANNCDKLLTFDREFARRGGPIPVILLTA